MTGGGTAPGTVFCGVVVGTVLGTGVWEAAAAASRPGGGGAGRPFASPTAMSTTTRHSAPAVTVEAMPIRMRSEPFAARSDLNQRPSAPWRIGCST